MSLPEYAVLQFPHELQTLMENWSNKVPPAMAEELEEHVHAAAIIFSRITKEGAIIVNNQAKLLAALNDAFARIQVLEAQMPQEHPDHERALAAIQDLEEANSVAEHDLIQLRAQATQDALVIKALAIRAPENSTNPPTGNSSGPQQAKISDPKKFDGTPDDLPEFIAQLRLKLHGNASLFPTEQLRLAYAVSLLEKNAFAQVQGHIKKTSIDLADIEALIKKLEDAFGDPDPTGTAERKLSTLQQRSSDFAGYLAEFNRLSSKVKWDDASKLHAFRSGLCNSIKNALIHKDEPTGLDDFIKVVRDLDWKIRRRAAEVQDSRAPPAPRPHAPAPAPAPATGHASYTSGGVVPMDLSSNRPRITPQEREARLREGRCFYCGGVGHMSSSYPAKRPARSAFRVSALAPPPVPPRPEEPLPPVTQPAGNV